MTQFELRGIFMARRYDSEDAKKENPFGVREVVHRKGV